MDLQHVNLCFRYLHGGVKTKFNQYQLEDEQGTEIKRDKIFHLYSLNEPIRLEGRKKAKEIIFTWISNYVLIYIDMYGLILEVRDDTMETFIM